MSDKREVRRRITSTRPTGGSALASVGRRTGRHAEPAAVAEYFGSDEDTPLIGLLRSIRPVSQKMRMGQYIHVSDLIGKCIRKIALTELSGARPPEQTIPDGQGITFAIGEALHDYVKQRFIDGHPGIVWAEWSCACGKSKEIGLYANVKDKVCDNCGTKTNKHNEISYIERSLLKGTPDLLLLLPEYNAFYVTELKSISADQWKELARPIPDHKVQIALYWRILRSNNIPVVDRVSILYVNKEFSFKMPYKEFMFDPSTVDLSPYDEDLEAMANFRETGVLPPRTVCGTPDAPDAKKCHVCVSCFGSD